MAGYNSRLEMVRRNSRAQITLGVRKYGALSRVQIAKLTGLSLPAVGRIVDQLITERVLKETGTVFGARGRPQTLVSINPDAGLVAGAFISPESIDVALADLTSEILVERTLSYENGSQDAGAMVAELADTIRRCVKSVGKDMSLLRGVGVTVAGLVDPMLGVIESLTNRTGWEGVPVGRMLEEHLRVPVYAENDVRAGALTAEIFSNEPREGGRLYLLIIEGIGAAVVNNHNVVRGAHDAAALLGHTTVEPDGPVCGCGNRGCLEAVASDMALIRGVWPELNKTAAEMAKAQRLDLIRKAVDMALGGDIKASRVLAGVARYIGIAVANAIAHYDPSIVYIGGTMVDAAPELFVDLVRREAMQRVWTRVRGVDIKSLQGTETFLLKGCIGLVLWQPYRVLQDANFKLRSLSSLRSDRRIKV